MRTYRTILFRVAFGLVAIFWLSTFIIMRDAPLLDGPIDEANRALAIFARDTAISVGLLIALSVFRQRTGRVAEKPKGTGTTLD